MITAQEYRKAIKALGMNQVQAGAFLALTDRTSRNYAKKGAPEIVNMLLQVMIKRKITVAQVRKIMNRAE